MGISMSLSVESPFVFGVKVSGETFTDRVVETERLKANFEHGINTILISPRRMGKTSLVEKVRTVVESDTLKIARFDAFGILLPLGLDKKAGRRHKKAQAEHCHHHLQRRRGLGDQAKQKTKPKRPQPDVIKGRFFHKITIEIEN